VFNLQPQTVNPDAIYLNPYTRQVMTIAEGLRERHSAGGADVELRMSFIAYRDYGANGEYYEEGVKVCPFTEDLSVLRSMVKSQKATSGSPGTSRDEPEDLCGGLRAALELDWRAQGRHLFIVADAPCHGQEYHSHKDRFPEGDPKGDTPEEQLARLTTKFEVVVKFIQVQKATDKMLDVINERLRGQGCREVAKVDLFPSPLHLTLGISSD